jgi:hypothetical protein
MINRRQTQTKPDKMLCDLHNILLLTAARYKNLECNLPEAGSYSLICQSSVVSYTDNSISE